MNNYFSTCTTVEEVKKLYKQLAMQHHPDRGGDTATMQAINAQYTAALKKMDGQTNVGSDKREHTYEYDAELEQAIISFIDSLIKSGALKDDKVNAHLIGTWVWITGETKPVKDALKAIGCKWHSKRECWFWHAEEQRSFYSRNGFDSLKARYGATDIKDVEKEADRRSSKKQQQRPAWNKGSALPMFA